MINAPNVLRDRVLAFPASVAQIEAAVLATPHRHA